MTCRVNANPEGQEVPECPYCLVRTFNPCQSPEHAEQINCATAQGIKRRRVSGMPVTDSENPDAKFLREKPELRVVT